MTIRQRQAPGSATAAIANGADAGLDRSAHFSWEDWFQHASTQQRAEALGLARQQGMLYPHQLPAVTNGVKPPAVAAAKVTEASSVIANLLAGKAQSLPAPQIEALQFFDADLDDLQQQAVARAISTPDLFLLQGLPGTGKSRTVGEIVLQAATRGWRVLFLAAHTSSLDIVLQRLIDRPDILALRHLDANEKPEALPAGLRAFTLEKQQKAFLDRAVVGARTNHERADSTCRQRRDAEPVWTDLQAFRRQWHDLDSWLQALDAELVYLKEAVEGEVEAVGCTLPVAVRLAELRLAHDRQTQCLENSRRTQQDALAQCDREAAQIAAKIAARDSAYQAKKHGRFWTLSYWLNLFNGQVIQETESLLGEQSAAQARRKEIAEEVERIQKEQQCLREQFAGARSCLIDEEVDARKQVLLQQRQAMEEERGRLDETWRSACQRLEVAPIEKTQAALAAAEQAWLQKKKTDEQQCQFALHWTKFVEEKGPQLAARLPSFANAVAASVSRWNADAKLRDAAAAPFDLLIVEDADTLTETDLHKLSRHARRCVLVGQALAEDVPQAPAHDKTPQPPLASTGCWNRLWQALDGEAKRWPCTWQREDAGLVCQLFPLCAEDRKHLENEGLVDAPDIELRILHRPHTRPCLAQVSFAPQCSFADAFHFMVREVQEFPLEPVGRTAWWSEDAHRHHRRFGASAGADLVQTWIEFEPGVRLGASSARIACIDFDKAAGWDRPKAEAWLQRHRPMQDHERTAFLQTPHRFSSSLAAIVQTVVRANDWLPLPAPETSERGPAFEFLAVPPIERTDWPREGAGLELDLSAPRHAERLPVGLRHGLPPRGFVNYLEAQALIRRLEAWTRTHSGGSAQVAVLALFDGQVELLRRLVEQSEILRARSFALEVALPSRMHQRECDVVFLSLTRSHAHRAVAFGENVKELPLALTRPRSRLFVFGDPGALSKRVHWHGPLDHLDAHAAQQELLRLSRFVAYLQNASQPLPTSNGSLNGRD